MSDSTTTQRQLFDPLASVCMAADHRPADWGDVNFRTLTPLLRALLSIDGTVTRFLEAFTMERVDVHRVHQSDEILVADNPWLEAPKDSPVIQRGVYLAGCRTRSLYAYALSTLVTSRLPDDMQEQLLTDPGGLGKIMLQSQFESRREVLWYGRRTMKVLPPVVARLCDGQFVSRSYRVHFQGNPLMVINENFPLINEDRLAHE